MQDRQDELSELECEEDDCNETPDYVADADNMMPAFVCDDHKEVFPEDTLTPIEEVAADAE